MVHCFATRCGTLIPWSPTEMHLERGDQPGRLVDVCTALDRGLNGKRLNDLNNSVREAIKEMYFHAL